MATLDDLMGNQPDNIITLDDITGQFGTKTQRQSYYEPETELSTDLESSLVDPDGEASSAEFGGGVWSPDEGEARPVSPERAHRTGERIARVIDTGFNFFASNIIAKDSGKDYNAGERDLEDIAQAWGDLAEEKQWEFSPLWQLLILYAIVYGPLAKEAFNDRRVMEIERRQATQEEKLKLMQYELEQLRKREAAEAARKHSETGTDS